MESLWSRRFGRGGDISVVRIRVTYFLRKRPAPSRTTTPREFGPVGHENSELNLTSAGNILDWVLYKDRVCVRYYHNVIIYYYYGVTSFCGSQYGIIQHSQQYVTGDFRHILYNTLVFNIIEFARLPGFDCRCPKLTCVSRFIVQIVIGN